MPILQLMKFSQFGNSEIDDFYALKVIFDLVCDSIFNIILCTYNTAQHFFDRAVNILAFFAQKTNRNMTRNLIGRYIKLWYLHYNNI